MGESEPPEPPEAPAEGAGERGDASAPPGRRAQRRHRGGGAHANRQTLARKNARQCIVTRERDPEAGLIRFVAGPDGRVVPDIHGRLPGRGAHVTARRALVERAARRHMFKRALRGGAAAPPDLADEVARLLRDDLVRRLPLLRKGGDVVAGAGKADAAVRSGQALLVLHAAEAAEDGVRKLANAIRATEGAGGDPVAVERGFSADELGMAFGGDRVIHAAVLRTGGGESFLARLLAFRAYCQDEEKGRHGPATPPRGGGPPAASGERSASAPAVERTEARAPEGPEQRRN